MKDFMRKSPLGFEYRCGVVGTTNENGKEYIIYTDYIEENGELRLFAGEKVENEVVDISHEKAEELIRDFKNNMENTVRGVEGMNYEDLSFTTIDEDGEERINDITKVVPNMKNSDEPYVVYTNYSLDDHDEFINQYGRVIEENGQFMLETNLTKEEIAYIEEMLQDEVVQYVNDALEEALND